MSVEPKAGVWKTLLGALLAVAVPVAAAQHIPSAQRRATPAAQGNVDGAELPERVPLLGEAQILSLIHI